MAVALINTAVHPAAIPYFTQFPLEPIPNQKFVTIEKVVELVDWVKKDEKSQLTNLTTLLKEILSKAKPGGDVVIVMHGNDAGLFIRIGPGIGFNVDAMRTLVMALDGKYEDEVIFKLLKLKDVGEWTRLKAQLQKMQGLALNRVDLRACVVGKDADVMYYLTKLFNCAVCCAPKAYDFYGRMEPGLTTKDPKVWEKWLAAHPGANIQTFPSGRFAFHYTIIKERITIDCMADSDEAAVAWVKRNLPSGNYTRGAIFYHGFTDKKSVVFAGDPRYRDNLVEAFRGGALPKVTVDPNAPIAP